MASSGARGFRLGKSLGEWLTVSVRESRAGWWRTDLGRVLSMRRPVVVAMAVGGVADVAGARVTLNRAMGTWDLVDRGGQGEEGERVLHGEGPDDSSPRSMGIQRIDGPAATKFWRWTKVIDLIPSEYLPPEFIEQHPRPVRGVTRFMTADNLDAFRIGSAMAQLCIPKRQLDGLMNATGGDKVFDLRKSTGLAGGYFRVTTLCAWISWIRVTTTPQSALRGNGEVGANDKWLPGGVPSWDAEER